MKTYEYVRELYWVDSDFYEVFNCSSHKYLETMFTEHGVFRQVLIEEGIFGLEDLAFLDALSVYDLDRMCIENNVYVKFYDTDE